MENCWFVLKQTHYPAPNADSMRKGKPTGPISLGHIIRDLKHLDQVINAESIKPFTRAMQIWETRMVDFKWNQAEEQATAVGAGITIPIVAAAGLAVGAHAGFAFRQSVKNYWEFEHLDRYIVQPTSSYVNDCLETEEIAQYVEEVQKLGYWSFFMITGLIVARGGGKSTTTEASGHEVSAGVNVSFPTLLEVGPEVTVSDSRESNFEVTHTTDFVWALRLAKISKGGLQRNWSMKTVFGRESFFGQSALFSEEREKIDIEAVVTAEGSRSDKFRVVQDDSLDSAFILFGPDVADSN
ncbi:hypothetical protein TWF788_005961 [Orbilia oligospora]|uniref:Uncharacterized protein n=1 Tax=Orbilia oligospora TaxID=2813651 RepID=A0A7C8U8R9_ORBOL|nr:hypothetical protein TWF788_005961 [Orbilia oligospora]